MSAVLNGRTHPGLLETFLEDLAVELGRTGLDPGAGPLPTACDRAHDQDIQLTVPLRGVRFRTEPGDPQRIVVTWAFRNPNGTTSWLDATVPEEVRSRLAGSTLSGDDMVTSVYEATLPRAQEALRAAWGLAEEP